MSERWLGVVVSSDTVTAVDAEVPKTGPIIIQSDQTWTLQDGDRPNAFRYMHKLVADYVRENGITRVAIQASALPLQGKPKLGLLHSAELRGVVASAAACSANTVFVNKGVTSRTFGRRDVAGYVADNGFWASETTGTKLRHGSRTAAMTLLALRKKEA